MSIERQERIAQTEALFREVNERIAESVQRFEGDAGDFVCECADPACTDHVEVPLREYERIRAHGARFVLAPGHEDESVEATVRDRGAYQIVEKTAPRAAAIVRQLNPRTA
jgi:hypothetical protein